MIASEEVNPSKAENAWPKSDNDTGLDSLRNAAGSQDGWYKPKSTEAKANQSNKATSKAKRSDFFMVRQHAWPYTLNI